ncbi:MAG: hypothetical protein HC836_35325 [Richelia sp. RM2_1_2]|nr:hypothetical protein [Richelia sp. RM2_1_2]
MKLTIDEIIVGMKLHDATSKEIAEVRDKTTNSVQVYLKATTIEGINCLQWFRIGDFNDRFKRVS